VAEQAPYAGLGPDIVLDAVESLGFAADGRLLALNSYENRVYRVGIGDRRAVVAKFYRPQRWSDEAIDEEHAFTRELAEAEIGVVPPIEREGRSLHRQAGFRFALADSVGGQAPEPGDRATLRQLGRALARLHAVGSRGTFVHRPTLDIDTYGRTPVQTLLGGDWVPAHLFTPFETLAGHLLDHVASLFDELAGVSRLRLHGDCHLGNILQRDDGIHLLDFDDALTGPAVQDLWMLVAGEGDDLRRQWDALLEGYGMFRSFDARELALVEALRTLRMFHFNGWIARRWHDPAFPVAFPWFAEPAHWERLIGQMHEQLAALQEPPLLT
jgi:Ser/Thr protein kinase RdoA (MazF antagonist)